MSDQLALAALDPNAAIEAAVVEKAAPAAVTIYRGEDRRTEQAQPGLTMVVEVDPPEPYKRWRFFVFYQLIRLAAWFYPFKFEIYRTAQLGDEE